MVDQQSEPETANLTGAENKVKQFEVHGRDTVECCIFNSTVAPRSR